MSLTDDGIEDKETEGKRRTVDLTFYIVSSTAAHDTEKELT